MSKFNHYSKPEYWYNYYHRNSLDSYDWLQTPEQINDILEIALKSPNKDKFKILDVGCGTSKIIEYLYENGFKNLTGIDINKKVIE